MYSVWYNPVSDKMGLLNEGEGTGAFYMEEYAFQVGGGFHFTLGPNAARRLAGAKWIKVGDL